MDMVSVRLGLRNSSLFGSSATISITTNRLGALLILRYRSSSHYKCRKHCVEEVAGDFRLTPKLVPNVYGNVSTVLVETLFLVSAFSFVNRYVKCKFCGSENFFSCN